jgi:serine/threonine protein kinase
MHGVIHRDLKPENVLVISALDVARARNVLNGHGIEHVPSEGQRTAPAHVPAEPRSLGESTEVVAGMR